MMHGQNHIKLVDSYVVEQESTKLNARYEDMCMVGV